MDKYTVWLAIAGFLYAVEIWRVSHEHNRLGYDLEQFLLAGRGLGTTRFILATTTLTLLGPLAVPHIGLLERSGLSYGFIALAAFVAPAASALIAGRAANFARLCGVLTPAQLIGAYYQSHALRRLVVLFGLAISLCLLVLALCLTADTLHALMPADNGVDRNDIVVLTALLLFLNAAIGGMGAVMRIAAGAALLSGLALLAGAFLALDAGGGIGRFIAHLVRLKADAASAPLFSVGAMFDPLPAAAPANIAWPGMMVLSALVATLGLATAPAAIMAAFTTAQPRAHGHQPFITALLVGTLLLTAAVTMAMLPHVGVPASALAGPVSASAVRGAETALILAQLQAAPFGSPIVLAVVSLLLFAALFSSAAAALLSAGAMIAHDVLQHPAADARPGLPRRMLTRFAIAAQLLIGLVIALREPGDPLPLFLLAGAYGAQLVPAFAGLCYLPWLTARAVLTGAGAGFIAVTLTSPVAQSIAQLLKLQLPFDPWPLGLHPALWGLGANLLALVAVQLAQQRDRSQDAALACKFRKDCHRLAEKTATPAADRPWMHRLALALAVLAAVLLLLLLLAVLGGAGAAEPAPSGLWTWQVRLWLIGAALVYLLAYPLQPLFDAAARLRLGAHPLPRQRIRVKARSRPSAGASAAPSSDKRLRP